MSVNPSEDENVELVKTKVTHDPGWNDPPVFSYDAVTATAQSKIPKRGLLLNKRVAFPLSSQPSSNKCTATKNMPPPMPTSTGPVVHLDQPPVTASNTTEENAKEDSQKEEALQSVMEGLECILKNSAYNFQKNESEIRRRLDAMKKMWEEDKLKPEIYVKMVQLTEALRNGNAELADHIHMGLMVDYVSLCSPWMAGIRQLIHHIKSQALNQDDITEELPRSQEAPSIS
ncbi:hypothetical protein B7P43_G12894 [Cryptotermes secundus]|uniref:SRA1/Sec31 domain-containing protein n=1 Tax=Cryptotermes secundus TaxID=105785 RepID=A0A2J7RPX6_9NEOP|nr:steroid receptor RNA activator 1 [Cryptotermes secundus]PNF42879.1 hypothetical protein B7P43_G12894 [Cryptotermes secundus]